MPYLCVKQGKNICTQRGDLGLSEPHRTIKDVLMKKDGSRLYMVHLSIVVLNYLDEISSVP